MNAIEQLQRMKQSADLALAERETARSHSPADADLTALLDKISVAAENVIRSAGSPIKVGIGGEFNAGKSLLIGALIGRADALPVNARPTTGNATHLRFVQAEDSEPTRIESHSISYLSEGELRECLRQGLVEAERFAKFYPPSAPALSSLRLDRPDLWQAVVDWCRAVWDGVSIPECLHLLREIYWMAQSFLRYRMLLRPDAYHVPAQIAEDGLILPDASEETGNQLKPDAFFQPPRLSAPPDQLSSALIASSFPLIRRVEMHVKLSREAWDISRVRGTNEFVLVDLPGLGAGHSTFRDRFICSRELVDVHTILLLLNSQRSGASGPVSLLSMMSVGQSAEVKPEHVIAGVGCFDLLPLFADGSQVKLKEWSTESDGLLDDSNLSDDMVLNGMPILGTTVRGARQLAGNDPDRLALVSPMIWVHWARQNLAMRVAGPNFGAASIDTDQWTRWGRLGERLAAERGSVLAPILQAYGSDGGISRLRNLIQRHVEKHGLEQRVIHTRRAEAALESLTAELRARMPAVATSKGGAPAASRSQTKQLQDLLAELARIYNRLHGTYAKSPPQLKVRSGGENILVRDAVFQELQFQVFSWDVWQRLFAAVRNDTSRLEASMPDDDADAGGDLLDANPQQAVPSRSADFYDAFDATLQATAVYARAKIQEALGAWLDAVHVMVAPYADRLLPLLKEQESLAAVFGERRGDLDALCRSITPRSLTEKLVKQVLPESATAVDARRAFPLPFDRKFAWAPEFKNLRREDRPSDGSRHQVEILRLETELGRSGAQQFSQIIGRAEEAAIQALGKTFTSVAARLAAINQNPVVLAALVDRLAESLPQTAPAIPSTPADSKGASAGVQSPRIPLEPEAPTARMAAPVVPVDTDASFDLS